jgi:hypothetical protein
MCANIQRVITVNVLTNAWVIGQDKSLAVLDDAYQYCNAVQLLKLLFDVAFESSNCGFGCMGIDVRWVIRDILN